jgi:serine protease Do
VVGINTAIVATGQGIGFAIPINTAKEVVAQLKKKGKVTRGGIGVYVQKMTPDLAKSFGLEENKGALVADVIAGGTAEAGGIKRGDIILRFDGKGINEMNELPGSWRPPGWQRGRSRCVARGEKPETDPQGGRAQG